MGVHDKHRERVRARLLNSGFDDLEPHQLLEFMLFSAIPRGDTNELAHTLINKFGGFNNVLEASAKELMLVDGIGPASALTISAHLAVIKKYLMGTFEPRTVLSYPEDITNYFEALCMGNKYETAYALFADKSKRVITHTKLSEGNLDSTGIYIDRLAEQALLNKAYYVVVAHNHPSGYIQPSPSDFEIAQRVIDSLRIVSRHLLDFVIVDHLNSFSFSREGFIKNGVLRSPYSNTGTTYADKDSHKTVYDVKSKPIIYLNDE